MLKRKLYENLKEWKNKDKGSYLCEEFGKMNIKVISLQILEIYQKNY